MRPTWAALAAATPTAHSMPGRQFPHAADAPPPHRSPGPRRVQLLAALATGHDGGECPRAFLELLRPWADTTRFFPADAAILALDKTRGCLVPAKFVCLHGARDRSWEEVEIEVMPESHVAPPSAQGDAPAAPTAIRVDANGVVREAQGYLLGELLLVAATEGYVQLTALLIDVRPGSRVPLPRAAASSRRAPLPPRRRCCTCA